MFVIDFISALILTFVLTVVFAAVARTRGWRRMPIGLGILGRMRPSTSIRRVLLIATV